MRDYEQSPSRLMDNLNDLGDPIEANYDMDEWYHEDGTEIESLSLDFKIESLTRP
jgi:hypothetical protein